MSRIHLAQSHRDRLSRYYAVHSRIYDATRWMFLFGRTRAVQNLRIRPNDTVVEVGCGTGHNFAAIQSRLQARGRLVAVDCSRPMLARSAARIEQNHWKNIELIDCEYGSVPITGGQADAVLMSYSLSMIPNW